MKNSGFAPSSLNDRSLALRAKLLAADDPDFVRVLQSFGTPPLWAREPGFATLVHIILEQQVSLASAQAAFDRLQLAIAPVTPRKFLKLNDDELKVIGFSQQKTLYCRLLAEALLTHTLDLTALHTMPDDEVRDVLTNLKGIGEWTASIYLLMVLLRPDVWPTGDIALATAWQRLKKLPVRPDQPELANIAEQWKPHRAVAARILWHFYLSEKVTAEK